jgi:hypothetical protein
LSCTLNSLPTGKDLLAVDPEVNRTNCVQDETEKGAGGGRERREGWREREKEAEEGRG